MMAPEDYADALAGCVYDATDRDADPEDRANARTQARQIGETIHAAHGRDGMTAALYAAAERNPRAVSWLDAAWDGIGGYRR